MVSPVCFDDVFHCTCDRWPVLIPCGHCCCAFVLMIFIASHVHYFDFTTAWFHSFICFLSQVHSINNLWYNKSGGDPSEIQRTRLLKLHGLTRPTSVHRIIWFIHKNDCTVFFSFPVGNCSNSCLVALGA